VLVKKQEDRRKTKKKGNIEEKEKKNFFKEAVSRKVMMKLRTAKTKRRKFETNIPRKGISGPQSQFPHSCVCERIIF
jgi:hypothetical protein